MGLLELFVTACVPVFNMLLVTGVGSFLASDFAGILNKEARKHLNNLVLYVFNPSLIATYLAKTVTMESLGKLWFMPVNILLSFIFGLFFGWILIQVTRAPAKLKGLILGCCSAGNVGNIFLIIVPALCKEKGSPFGAPDACQTYGLAYSSLSLAIGAVFLWSFAYNIIRVTSQVSEGDGDALTNQTAVFIPRSATGPVSEKFSTSIMNECTLPLISTDIPPNKSKVPLLGRARQFLPSIAGGVDFRKLFAPSTIAVIVGLILGATPLTKNALTGENAPLRALQESADLHSGAAVPAVTLIMGGNLLKAGLGGRSSVQPSVIAGVIVVRYVLLPLLGTGLVRGAVRLGLVQPDPLYQFILLLPQYAVPPAMNIGTMTQLFGVGEGECSVIFVWAYALASGAVTACSAFFMWTLSP
ncbi:protein PIN-LIKES 3 [Setaria italica]|uniref:protein PIN-LIKES 3 n=1 Tax=Setaria italica TaxID=4555 RepID=UPI000646BBD5|nr:protein PIN-LIKES 3 [Setaria italica]